MTHGLAAFLVWFTGVISSAACTAFSFSCSFKVCPEDVACVAADGWQFGSGHHGNSVCPSLACLDVKMYNFLNSEACICTVQDLKSIHDYATDAQAHLKLALIGTQSTQPSFSPSHL